MKLLNILILFLSFLKVNAQYTITPSQKPDIGDSYDYINIDTSNIINGTSGANQIWNYTNLILPTTPTVNSIYYSNATTIPNHTWYLGAYMALIGSDGGFTAFDSDPNNYSLNWIKIAVGTSTKYADPITRYHYPISFGSVFNDSVKFGAYDETPSGYGYIGSYLSYGVHSYTCTGYGTLNLPNGVSLPNTIKLNMQYFKTYREQITPTVNGQDTTYYEEYFNSISKFPILAFYKNSGHDISFGNTTTHYSKDIKLNVVAITGLKNQELSASDISIFPNPSKNIFYIELRGQVLDENPIFTLQNSLGQILDIKSKETISNGHFKIDLENYHTGLYFLTIKTRKGVITKKILVE
jgi:hypothetical protein